MSDSHSRKPPPRMGKVVMASQVITSGLAPRRARNIILLLAVSLGLLMTGYAIIMPIFARRLGEFGSGVGVLSLMSTAYALAGIVASPFMGMLADRIGRRPLVLGSLAAFALANIGFLLATSTEMLIVMRALEGALSAGLFPAALGIVADVAPEDRRARWLGWVMGGASVGWVLGPMAGGVLYDTWGFEAPFVLSAAMGFFAFVAAAILVPETRPRDVRRREALRRRRTIMLAPVQTESLWATLPRPLSAFAVLLFVSFAMFFAWAFFEPQLLFYVFDDLGWTTAQFGLAAGGYGLASALSQTTLGQVGDRFGRKPSIVVGLCLFSAQFAGLVFTASFGLVMLSFAIAGLGEGLVSPALGAFLVDISEERHRSRVMGIRTSASSLGGVVGPLLAAAAAARSLPPQSAFVGAIAVVLVGALLALLVLGEPGRAAREAAVEAWPVSDVRAIAAQASLRSVVNSANSVRGQSATRRQEL
ncbi:MAG: MFS transporter [Anaerolineae bacterium]|nr:MAG: MFS transporter [Anaerolineae bacterium]